VGSETPIAKRKAAGAEAPTAFEKPH